MLPPAWTREVVGLTETPDTTHEPVFAAAGAAVVALLELTTTVPESVWPASSVTVNLRVTVADDGATIVAAAEPAP